MCTKRCKDYLNTYKFYPNNIYFRINSSKAIEKFKNVQSFQLNQLVNNNHYFAKDRREILLLKYDMWSRWLYEIENYCIEAGGLNEINDLANDYDIDIISKLAEKTNDMFHDILRTTTLVKLNQTLVDVWFETHDMLFNYLLERIKQLSGMKYIDLFTKIVDESVIVMQHTLMGLHEIDSLINGDAAFISVDQMSVKYFEHYNESLIVKKLKTYQKFFDFDTIYLKNYTGSRLHDSVINNIDEIGINIDYKKCIIN